MEFSLNPKIILIILIIYFFCSIYTIITFFYTCTIFNYSFHDITSGIFIFLIVCKFLGYFVFRPDICHIFLFLISHKYFLHPVNLAYLSFLPKIIHSYSMYSRIFISFNHSYIDQKNKKIPFYKLAFLQLFCPYQLHLLYLFNCHSIFSLLLLLYTHLGQ